MINKNYCFKIDQYVFYSHNVDNSIFPQGGVRVLSRSRRDGTPWDRCRTGWSRHPADIPHSSPDGQSETMWSVIDDDKDD